MHLSDPWSDAALFSAAFVGPHGVVAGGAEHGVVHVWDVRFAGRTLASPADELDADAAGWSVFSPHGRGSPVYALAGDGARVWGATERRAFVLAFDDGELGPAVGGHQGDAGGAQRGRRGSPVKHDRGWNTNCAAEARQKVMGYRHGEGGMTLFESRTHGLALPDIGSLSLYA
jgi:hypothetical protein